MLHSVCMAQSAQASTDWPANQCPDTFFNLPLFPEASLCQSFAETLPASLIYHAKADPSATRLFYVEQLGEPESEATNNDRTILQYQNGQRRIVISPDGSGSQIDILVTQEPNI